MTLTHGFIEGTVKYEDGEARGRTELILRAEDESDDWFLSLLNTELLQRLQVHQAGKKKS